MSIPNKTVLNPSTPKTDAKPTPLTVQPPSPGIGAKPATPVAVPAPKKV
ncbi:MAG TPA: hypothetical protein VJ570_00025 [Holophagaceae bacterium]|nr:hypothetical protein [Holophagaceae bacterium]